MVEILLINTMDYGRWIVHLHYKYMVEQLLINIMDLGWGIDR